MGLTKRMTAAFKAVGVICSVMVVASGVTFAALQSQDVTLAGNQITSATANMLISNGNNTFTTTTPGFSFDNVEPGGSPMPVAGHNLHVRNTGTSDLHLRLTLNPNSLRNVNSVNIGKVMLTIVPAEGGTSKQVTLQSLVTAYTNREPLSLDLVAPAGQDTVYSLRMQMAADAVSSTTSSAVIDNLDLIFSGATQAQAQ